MRWTKSLRFVSLLLLVLSFGLCGSGCAIIQVSTGRNKIARKPRPKYKHIKSLRENGAIVVSNAKQAVETGLDAGSQDSKDLLDAALGLTAYIGNPAKPPETREDKDKAIKTLALQNEKYDKDVFKWEDDHEKDKPSGGSGLMVWIWILVIALGLLCFFFPAIGIPLVKYLIGKAVKAAKTAGQLVKNSGEEFMKALQEHMDDLPEDQKKKLKETLKKHTTTPTKKWVDDWKHRIGLK